MYEKVHGCFAGGMDKWMGGWVGVDGWIDGWIGWFTDKWMISQVDGWVDRYEWMDRCLNERLYVFMDRRMCRWMDEWMRGWMDVWMDG